MKNFVVKDASVDLHKGSTEKRFRLGRADDGRVKIVYEERNALAPHSWRHVAATVLDDNDMFGYLDAAGVRI